MMVTSSAIISATWHLYRSQVCHNKSVKDRIDVSLAKVLEDCSIVAQDIGNTLAQEKITRMAMNLVRAGIEMGEQEKQRAATPEGKQNGEGENVVELPDNQTSNSLQEGQPTERAEDSQIREALSLMLTAFPHLPLDTLAHSAVLACLMKYTECKPTLFSAAVLEAHSVDGLAKIVCHLAQSVDANLWGVSSSAPSSSPPSPSSPPIMSLLDACMLSLELLNKIIKLVPSLFNSSRSTQGEEQEMARLVESLVTSLAHALVISGVPTTPPSASRPSSSPTKLCELCESVPATLQCSSCNMKLCIANGCDADVHQSQDKDYHTRTFLSTAAGASSSARPLSLSYLSLWSQSMQPLCQQALVCLNSLAQTPLYRTSLWLTSPLRISVEEAKAGNDGNPENSSEEDGKDSNDVNGDNGDNNDDEMGKHDTSTVENTADADKNNHSSKNIYNNNIYNNNNNNNNNIGKNDTNGDNIHTNDENETSRDNDDSDTVGHKTDHHVQAFSSTLEVLHTLLMIKESSPSLQMLTSALMANMLDTVGLTPKSSTNNNSDSRGSAAQVRFNTDSFLHCRGLIHTLCRVLTGTKDANTRLYITVVLGEIACLPHGSALLVNHSETVSALHHCICDYQQTMVTREQAGGVLAMLTDSETEACRQLLESNQIKDIRTIVGQNTVSSYPLGEMCKSINSDVARYEPVSTFVHPDKKVEIASSEKPKGAFHVETTSVQMFRRVVYKLQWEKKDAGIFKMNLKGMQAYEGVFTKLDQHDQLDEYKAVISVWHSKNAKGEKTKHVEWRGFISTPETASGMKPVMPEVAKGILDVARLQLKEPPLRQCEHCSKASVSMQHCGRCKKVYYCNGECQRNHWSYHKAPCKKHLAGVECCSKFEKMKLFFELEKDRAETDNLSSFETVYV